MLDHLQRQDRYHVQNGGYRLTPKQVRRIAHKAGHQNADAAAAREDRSALRAVAREARKKRLGLLAR